jgi:hypothetical protein
MSEARRRPTVGEWVELQTLQDDGRTAVWTPAKVVQIFDEFLVLQSEVTGRTPAYGYDDEGRAWRFRADPALAERAAVVAFLRNPPPTIPSYQRCLAMAADAIERGEHR